jgi:hypothetical protein
MTPKSKPACRPEQLYHVNNHTDSSQWTYTYCDCGMWQVPPGLGDMEVKPHPIQCVKIADGAVMHVNSMPVGLDGSHSRYCDCGKYVLAPQHYEGHYEKEEPMTAPNMTGGWKMLDRDEYPDPVITWVVQLPNGEYLEDTKARGSTPTHRIFTDIRDAKEIVISMMLKAKEIGIDDYKPVIITRSVEHQVHKRHSVNQEHTDWIEDNARTLRGEMGA